MQRFNIAIWQRLPFFFPIKYGKHLNLVADADGDGITYHRGEKEGLSRRKWSIEGDFKKLSAN